MLKYRSLYPPTWATTPPPQLAILHKLCTIFQTIFQSWSCRPHQFPQSNSCCFLKVFSLGRGGEWKMQLQREREQTHNSVAFNYENPSPYAPHISWKICWPSATWLVALSTQPAFPTLPNAPPSTLGNNPGWSKVGCVREADTFSKVLIRSVHAAMLH